MTCSPQESRSRTPRWSTMDLEGIVEVAGNSQRRGAIRKPGTKKGSVVGSGGQKSKGLEGRGATPKAEQRKGHPAARRAAAAAKADTARRKQRKAAGEGTELIAGRNPVVECLRADVPGHRALRRARHRSRRPRRRSRAHRRRPGHLRAGGAARRTRPADQRRHPPGHRPTGPAVQLHPPRRPARRRQRLRGAARCSSPSTASPTRATSARSSAPPPRSAPRASCSPSAARQASPPSPGGPARAPRPSCR